MNKQQLSRRYMRIGLLCILAAYAFDVVRRPTEKILVATEIMHEGIFSQTVLIIAGNWLSGWSGVILNRPLQPLASNDVPEFIRNEGLEIGYGGPVSYPKLMILERRDTKANMNNAFLIRSWDDAMREQPDLLALVRQDAHDQLGRYRLFLGYAGWSPLQLENEIAQTHQWESVTLDSDFVGSGARTISWAQLRRIMTARSHAKMPPAKPL